MSIQKYIAIDTVYTRSINLERDIDSTAIAKAYIPTSRALLTLRSIAKTFSEEARPRSWALIGPYGSGKSSFAVYLAHLLDNPKHKATQDIHFHFVEVDEHISDQIVGYIDATRGCLPILLTGTPEPLGLRFLASLRDAASRFWQSVPGRPHAIVAKLIEASDRKDVTTHEILTLVEELRTAVETKRGKGLLIIFDELGKFLEYEARHYGANDIYLLQALAEMAVNSPLKNSSSPHNHVEPRS